MLCAMQACTALWQSCTPSKGNCCSGTSCQLAEASFYNLKYACKPLEENCLPASTAGKPSTCEVCIGGGVCCVGLECRWDTYTQRGYCMDPNTCLPAGSICSRDSDCRSNHRCTLGRCSAASAASVRAACNRKCMSAECVTKRQKECAYSNGLHAASLGMVVKSAQDQQKQGAGE